MTTYILGAGASVHAGYPLTWELGRRLADWIIARQDRRYRTEIDRLLAAYSGGLGDFERIVTELEWPTGGSPFAHLDEVARKGLHTKLLDAVCDYFKAIHDEKERAHLYGELATKRLKNDDTIITFNYDLALDRELKKSGRWSVSNGYGFEVHIEGIPKTQVKLLKLHGSTNWAGQPRFRGSNAESAHFGDRPILDGLESLGYDGVKDPHLGWHLAAHLAVIMPGMNKRFYVWSGHAKSWEEFYDDIWDKARAAVRTSDEIVIIGYSLPEADLRARAMILSEANREALVTVCCRSDSDRIVGEFDRYAFQHTQIVPSFEDWLGCQ